MSWRDQFEQWLEAPLSNGTALTMVAWLTVCALSSLALFLMGVHW